MSHEETIDSNSSTLSSQYPQTLRFFPREAKNIKHDRYFQGLERSNLSKLLSCAAGLWYYNGPRAGWEFLVMLVAITDICLFKLGKYRYRYRKKPGKYRGNIVSNEKAGIAHPYLQVSRDFQNVSS
jgi:hypothetical protein